MSEQDIYDLQIKLSYLEDFIENLNSVIIDQNKENSRMQREIKSLQDKLSQLEERIDSKEQFRADDPPPHY
ncbi:SlyX family protein [Spirochaeta isovalerica]|uniref:Putative coiled-coil protein SlyX n=1 Tax=Spirochaeta isovalerica TaxID=150 RepID=A0A841R5P3_9SPIO|nr:SlyX family protein [Spirochaeta isovalerica]MBB6479175.1 putative coiled-coil protein SlyX [Spirochaeta isovalerica]